MRIHAMVGVAVALVTVACGDDGGDATTGSGGTSAGTGGTSSGTASGVGGTASGTGTGNFNP